MQCITTLYCLVQAGKYVFSLQAKYCSRLLASQVRKLVLEMRALGGMEPKRLDANNCN